jgi:alpha-L-fucosidase
VQHTFATNLAKGARITASNTRGKTFGGSNVLDQNGQTYWATADDTTTPSLELALKTPQTFDIISLQEYIPLGQRVQGYTIEVQGTNSWEKIYDGTSIGAKRLIALDKPVTATNIRLHITKSPVCVTLSEFGLYKRTE